MSIYFCRDKDNQSLAFLLLENYKQ